MWIHAQSGPRSCTKTAIITLMIMKPMIQITTYGVVDVI